MKVLQKNSSNNDTKSMANKTNNTNKDYTIVNTNDIINNIVNKSAKITWSHIRVELP